MTTFLCEVALRSSRRRWPPTPLPWAIGAGLCPTIGHFCDRVGWSKIMFASSLLVGVLAIHSATGSVGSALWGKVLLAAGAVAANVLPRCCCARSSRRHCDTPPQRWRTRRATAVLTGMALVATRLIARTIIRMASAVHLSVVAVRSGLRDRPHDESELTLLRCRGCAGLRAGDQVRRRGSVRRSLALSR